MQKVKFSVFADLHIHDHWAPNCYGRLDAILNRAKENNVDFVIHCGDFTQPPGYSKAVEIYNNFELPTYHVMGNHEFDHLSHEDVIKAYGMSKSYYFFEKNGFRFIILDDNYCRVDGEDIPYSAGNYFKLGENRDYISQEQIEWLEDTVMSSPYPMVVFTHGSLLPNRYKGIRNSEDVQKIFRKAHANGKRILMCLNGHYHVDYMKISDQTCYFDVNASTMYCLCEKHEPHNKFGEEFHKNHPGSSHILIYNDPVHAIVTLSDDGTIEIEGMKSSFFMGVSKSMVTDSDYYSGIEITPNVSDEKICLPMKL